MRGLQKSVKLAVMVPANGRLRTKSNSVHSKEQKEQSLHVGLRLVLFSDDSDIPWPCDELAWMHAESKQRMRSSSSRFSDIR